MYTTLAILKNVKACVPGYSRMISFFGTKAENKDQKIPLHVVALVGGASDASWALSNGVIIEDEEFQRFYRRHAVGVFKQLCCTNSLSPTTTFKSDIVKNLVNEALKVHTFEQLETFLKKARGYHFDHRLFTYVLSNDAWVSPHKFIEHCFNIVQNTYTLPEKWAHKESAQAVAPRTAPTRAVRDLDEDDENDDERDRDEDDEDDDGPRRRIPARSTKVGRERYWIQSSVRRATHGQNIAFMLSEDPYAFMGDLKFKTPPGVSIEKVEGKTVMKASMDDTKEMFYLIRELTAKTELDDQDGDDD